MPVDLGRLANAAQNIAKNLFTLEVNTILKESMTGEKMPDIEHALIDIVRTYDDYLLRYERQDPEDDKLKTRAASLAIFDQLRTRASRHAKALLKHAHDQGRELDPVEERALFKLCRIREASDQMKGVFESLDARHGRTIELNRQQLSADKKFRLDVDFDDIVVIRKMWELGLEEIIMQTTIQLDGDVVTRLQPQYVRPEYKLLLDVHQEGVKTATSFWRSLADLIGSLFSQLGRWADDDTAGPAPPAAALKGKPAPPARPGDGKR